MLKTLVRKCIYNSPNGIMVLQNPLYRWLTFNSEDIQTLICRKNPAKPALEYISYLMYAAQKNPGDCCLLGLGGAGVVHALSPYLGDFPLTAVECNPEVIEIARNYFMTHQLYNLRITCVDASRFVQQSTQQYQHILVDLYNAYSFPQQCASKEFFLNCKRLLLPYGIISINLANREEQFPIFKLIQDSFSGHTLTLPVKNTANVIIFAGKEVHSKHLLQMVTQDKNLSGLEWDTLWGYIAKF
jgi:spermidine synthase